MIWKSSRDPERYDRQKNRPLFPHPLIPVRKKGSRVKA